MPNKQQIFPRPRRTDRILLGLEESPVVALLGARQVGKTTLARMIAADRPDVVFFDLERPSGRAALEMTPELVLSEAKGLVIIDEIQRMPGLMEILRPLCDDPARKASFLLLGSVSLETVKGVSESLAGRVQFVPISGLSLEEVGVDEQSRLWFRGGFPRAFLAETDDACARWLEGFRQTFLERDIPNLGLTIPSFALSRFWAMLAHYHGQTWNATELARSLDVRPRTANRYRDLLAATFMVRILQPWHENMSKRQIKTPKVYIRDSGLLHHLLGIQTMGGLRSHPRYGASWEGFALEQVLTQFGDRDAYFWGTRRGAEMDLLLLRGGRRWGFEFKCTDAPTSSRSMHLAIDDLGLDHLWVVYPGTSRFPITKSITALPLRSLSDLDLGSRSLSQPPPPHTPGER
jgi:uncharacterized protein